MASLQILLFDVGGTCCAIRRDAVRELLPLPRLFQPPSLPRPVAGFFNLGGMAVPVLRLDVLFGVEQSKVTAEAELYRHLMLVEGLTGRGKTALLVDRVVDFVELDQGRLSKVNEAGTLNGCVEAEIDLAGQLVHLLCLQRILFAEEQQAVDGLARKAQDRLSEWVVTA